MAASLKNPAHFMKPLSERNGTSSNYKLLPPSALTVSAKEPPGVGVSYSETADELQQAKEQIEQLKKENESLKKSEENSTSRSNVPEPETQKTSQSAVHKENTCPHPQQGQILYQAAPRLPTIPQQMPAQPISFPYPSSHPAPHHLLELQRQTEMVVSRQAADIARLKTELSAQEAQHVAELARLKTKTRDRQAGREEEMSALMDELKKAERHHKQEKSSLVEVHQREMSRLTEKLHTSGEDLHRLRAESDHREADLSSRLTAEQQVSKERTELLENDIREKEDACSSLKTQVAQLKAYIGEALPGSKTAAQWNVEKQNYDKKIKIIEQEKTNAKSTIDMLNLRLSSLNEIMTIQENEMSKTEKSQDGERDTRGIILTKWREKVFALLVQRKSLEIVTKKDAVAYEDKVKGLVSQLEGALNKVRMLEHSLADKEAQLQLEKKNILQVEQELVSVQEVAGMLDSKLRESEACLCRLRDSTLGFHRFSNGVKVQHDHFISRLTSYEQRLSFATSRMELLQDLLARRDTMLRLRVGATGLGGSCSSATQTEEASQSLPPAVSAEIERLKTERDSLASRLKEDSVAVQERVADMRREMHEQIERWKEESMHLKAEMENKERNLESIQEDLADRDESLTEAKGEILKLKTNLARSQLVAEGASDEKCHQLEAQHTLRLSEMEKRLNEARREHAKAVVSLRQLERQSSRERDRSKEMLASQEDHLTGEVSRLRARLADAEADRNLLMATLRQEGLLGSFKGRQTGIQSHLLETQHTDSSSDATEKSGNIPMTGMNHDRSSGPRIPPSQENEPLHAVLKDLQMIAAKVLEEDDEEEEDEDDGEEGERKEEHEE